MNKGNLMRYNIKEVRSYIYILKLNTQTFNLFVKKNSLLANTPIKKSLDLC